MSRIALVNIEFDQKMESFVARFYNFYYTTTKYIALLHSFTGSLWSSSTEQKNLWSRVYKRISFLQLNLFLEFTLTTNSYHMATVVSNNFSQVVNMHMLTILNNNNINFSFIKVKSLLSNDLFQVIFLDLEW